MNKAIFVRVEGVEELTALRQFLNLPFLKINKPAIAKLHHDLSWCSWDRVSNLEASSGFKDMSYDYTYQEWLDNAVSLHVFLGANQLLEFDL